MLNKLQNKNSTLCNKRIIPFSFRISISKYGYQNIVDIRCQLARFASRISNTICLYGAGEIGGYLYEAFSKCGISIYKIFDSNKKVEGRYINRKLSEFDEKEVPNGAVIVVASVSYYYEIIELIVKKLI